MRVLKLITKNMLRHKLRTSLTILGIAIAVIAFCLLRTVVTAWHSGVEGSSANRLIVRHSVSFIFPLPEAYADQIRKIPGVDLVSWANWFGGVYIDKNQFFARLAVDADTYFSMYPEYRVPPDQMAQFLRERNSCIIGNQIAERYHLKPGDLMTLEGDIYPGEWQFVVRGIYTPGDKLADPSNMLFHWTYVDERMRKEMPGREGNVGWYIVKIHNAADDAGISNEIDALFANSRAETKTETERAFQQDFLASASAILTAMNVISFVIIGIIMLVLGNTMIMAARERIREFAVLKTLGFHARHIVGLIAGESLLIAAIGGGIGLLLAFPLTEGFAAALPKGWFPVFDLEPITLAMALGAAFLVGALAAIFPIQRALGTSIVDGLRDIG
ncbi:MAG: ABC transporter permease [Bacteroidota bacterium]